MSCRHAGSLENKINIIPFEFFLVIREPLLSPGQVRRDACVRLVECGINHLREEPDFISELGPLLLDL